MLSFKYDYVYLQWISFILRKDFCLSTLNYEASSLVMKVMKVLAVLWCLPLLLWDSHLLTAGSIVPWKRKNCTLCFLVPLIQ